FGESPRRRRQAACQRIAVTLQVRCHATAIHNAVTGIQHTSARTLLLQHSARAFGALALVRPELNECDFSEVMAAPLANQSSDRRPQPKRRQEFKREMR